MQPLRRLHAGDLHAFRTLRLTSLLESPSAFSATVDSEQALSDAQVLQRITGHAHSGIWGVWNANHVLVGCAGLRHLAHTKCEHKASVYAVYVAPCARGKGWGQRLLEALMAYARDVAQLRQLQLGVMAYNTPALQLYRKLGFVAYGREPDALCVDGTYHDEVLMQCKL